MFTILQVLNNNVVSAADESGRELILTGKGLGFKAQSGKAIDPHVAEKVFVLNQGDATSERLKVLMESLPLEVVQITEFICDEAEKALNRKFGNGLFVSLSDHLDFAIKRSKDGLSIPNPFEWEIRSFYDKEFKFAEGIIQKILLNWGVLLEKSEACSIALHIINADNSNLNDFKSLTKIVYQILNIVKYVFNVELDENSQNYHRFVTHLKFFAQRIGKKEVITNHDSLLSDLLIKELTKTHQCVDTISEFVRKTYGHPMSDSEKLYLVIHIDRVLNDVR